MVDPRTATRATNAVTSTGNFCINLYYCTDPCRKTLDELNINSRSLRTQWRLLLKEMEIKTIQIAERPHMKPTSQVTDWLKEAEGIVKDIESILFVGGDKKTPRSLPERCPGGCFYKKCCCDYEHAKNVEDSVTIAREKITEGREILVTEMFERNNTGGEALEAAAATLQEEDLVGMGAEFNKACALLEQDGFGSVGILGMGGVGKTTLLKRIAKKLLKKESHLDFDRATMVWVDMSAVEDIPTARLAIAKELGLRSPEDKIDQGQIKAALEEKKFVLLLDDLGRVKEELQQRDVLAMIGVPKQNNCKSKVFFTTRFPEACSTMGAGVDRRIQLRCLEGDDPTILFQKVVQEPNSPDSQEKHELVRQLAGLCGGLPLALVRLGRLMRDRSVEEWRATIRTLSELNPEPGMEQEVFNVLLKKSYDSLPKTHQSCFLYACLFPKTCLAEKEELIHYWVAEEILKNDHNQLCHHLEDGHAVIAHLKRLDLLDLDHRSNDSSTVKMHDMIHAAALWTTQESFFVPSAKDLDELPNRDWLKVERISLVGKSIDKLKNEFQFDKLSTVILKKSTVREFIEKNCYDFFDSKSMPSLRVLDLSWCDIDIFPIKIAGLTTLQYLNISHNGITELPTELKQLKKLKFLDLSYLDKLHLIPPQVLVTFSKLQSLNLYHSGFGPADGEGNLLFGDGIALLNELEQLKYLDNLGLTVKSGVALQKLQDSKKLNCVHSLFITRCKDLSSLRVPSLDTAKNLKVLRVHNCSDLKEFTIFRDSIVNQLVPSITMIKRSFQNLRNIEIEGCWVLKDLSWLKYAPQLQLLKVDKCGQMQEVINDDGSSFVASFESNEHMFSNLKSIHLSYLPELKLFCNPPELTLPALEQITVLFCPKMVKLPLKAENANGTLKSIKTNRNLWDRLTWEDEVTKSVFFQLCKFES